MEVKNMKVLTYKKHDIVLDAKSYYNAKTKSGGGDCIAKIYIGDQLLFKMRYLYYTELEIVKMLKDRINNKDFKTTDDSVWIKDNLPQAKQLLEGNV